MKVTWMVKIRNYVLFVSIATTVLVGLYYLEKKNLTKENQENYITDLQGNSSLDTTEFHSLVVSTAHKQMVNDLRTQEKELWAALEKQTGVSSKDFKEYTHYYSQSYKDGEKDIMRKYSKGSVSKKTRLMVLNIFKDFKIDPKKITILPWSLHTAAAATQNYIFINERELNKYDLKARRWVVAHELIHIKFNDHMANSVIKSIFGDELKDNVHAANAIKRFFEIRADTLAALKTQDYSQGFVDFFEKYLKVRGHDDAHDHSHPKSSFRLKTAHKILNDVYKKDLVHA